MVRPSSRLSALAVAALWFPSAIALAQVPPPQPPPPAPPAGAMDGMAGVRSLFNPGKSEAVDPAELAGLPKGIAATRLDWERVYRLALLRARATKEGAGKLAEALDPKALEEEARRAGVVEFEAFRKAFLGGGAFRDPSKAMFDLMGRQQRFANARDRIASLDRLRKVMDELVQGEASGQTQLQLDLVEDAVQDARIQLVETREGYREALDRFKVELGLSPHAAVALDASLGSGFRAGFDTLAMWSLRPDRSFVELPRIVSRLPALVDVVLGGVSVPTMVETPEAMEALLRTMTEEARKTRGEAIDADVELGMRRGLRRLVETNIRYQLMKRKLLLLVRMRDQAHEQLIAPPGAAASASMAGERVTDLLAIEGNLRRAQDALVDLWATYQTLRISLARDLGTVPAKSWDDLYETLDAGSGPVGK